MNIVRLKIQGGGRLEVHGSLAAPRILIVLSRENFRHDDALIARLTGHFSRRWTVAKYETRAVETTRRIDRACFAALPLWLRQTLKALLLLCWPARRRHYSPGYRAKVHSIAYRVESLRQLIQLLGPGKEVIFLTRSAGGRVATLVADEAGVSRVVCLGYPFKHPDEPPDPSRYEHLAGLRMPLLILQGTRDNYGGIETAGIYRLAPETTLEWIDTDHGFNLAEGEWTQVLDRIDRFMTKEPVSVQPAPVLAAP